MVFQRTLNNSIRIDGIGLHSGKTVHMTIHPAVEDHGIVFARSDMPGAEPVPADVKHVVATSFATSIGNGDFTISTVEHLMAAFSGLGVNNALVEVDADELPVGDGSAVPFVERILEAGLRKQSKLRKYIQLVGTVSVKDGDKRATLSPSSDFRVNYTIEYDHPVIRTQHFKMTVTTDKFIRELANARTFGFLQDVNMLKANGFAKGGSLDNAVVIGNTGILNSDGLRHPDEFVRHKALDAIGDLYMLGMPILGDLVAKKSGHYMHHLLTQELLAHPESWHIAEFSKGKESGLQPVYGYRPAMTMAN